MMEVFNVYQEILRQIERNEIGAAVEADHLFWQVVVGSLLERLIVTLGRIFDKQKRAHSVFKVLDAARDHIELLSRDALARRQDRIAGERPEWLDLRRTSETWEPNEQAFADLTKDLQDHEAEFQMIYRPLRHEYFAHRALDPTKSSREMFRQANPEKLATMITFLRDVAEALFQTFINGQPPERGKVDYESARSNSLHGSQRFDRRSRARHSDTCHGLRSTRGTMRRRCFTWTQASPRTFANTRTQSIPQVGWPILARNS